MRTKSLKQLSTSFLIVLSLFVSSVAACLCPHHLERTAVSSCHEHQEQKQDGQKASSEKFPKFEIEQECCCLQPTPKIFSKSESVRIVKQNAVLPVAPVILKTVAVIGAERNFYFEKPFYLTDSFYNIKSPRGPPLLSTGK